VSITENGYLARAKFGVRSAYVGVAVACGVAFASAVVAAGQQNAGPLTAGQAFKNVQVLQDVPVDDFLPLMGLMTASVGGDCNTCHDAAGTDFVVWEADNPIKKIARQMSAMVVALNKANFGGRTVVTCWTCHRGRSIPVQTPTLDQVYGELDFLQDDLVMATAPGLPRPDIIVDRYLQAIGGAEKLNAITSYVATGTSQGFRGFGGGGSVQIFAKHPDQRSMVIEYKAEGRDATVRSFDGKTGWIKTPLNVLGEYQLGGGELDGARLDAQMTFPGQIKQVLTRMRTLDPTEINGREVDVVQGNGLRGLFATLYFDTETGLLTRMVRFGSSPIGRLPTQFEFSDYRDVDGVKLPFKTDFVWLDGRDAIQLNEIRLNLPVDASRFDRPTALEKRN
jgi:hypothetical protein